MSTRSSNQSSFDLLYSAKTAGAFSFGGTRTRWTHTSGYQALASGTILLLPNERQGPPTSLMTKTIHDCRVWHSMRDLTSYLP